MPQREPGWMFKRVLLMLGVAVLCGGAVGAYNIIRGPIFESLRMAQLAPMPAAASNLAHQSRQTDAGYEEDVTFDAPMPAIDAWLQRSPSVRKAGAPAVENGRSHYKLPTLRASSSADLYVDPAASKVEIILMHH